MHAHPIQIVWESYISFVIKWEISLISPLARLRRYHWHSAKIFSFEVFFLLIVLVFYTWFWIVYVVYFKYGMSWVVAPGWRCDGHIATMPCCGPPLKLTIFNSFLTLERVFKPCHVIINSLRLKGIRPKCLVGKFLLLLLFPCSFSALEWNMLCIILATSSQSNLVTLPWYFGCVCRYQDNCTLNTAYFLIKHLPVCCHMPVCHVRINSYYI